MADQAEESGDEDEDDREPGGKRSRLEEATARIRAEAEAARRRQEAQNKRLDDLATKFTRCVLC